MFRQILPRLGGPMSRGAAVALVVCAATILAGDGAKGDDPGFDAFGIGLGFTRFCDFRDGAALSDACYAFMGAAIEMGSHRRLGAEGTEVFCRDLHSPRAQDPADPRNDTAA
jgi:hypothetical protein